LAGGVANAEQDRLIPVAGAFQSLVAPWVPVRRVIRVLQQVGAGLVYQTIRHSDLDGETVSSPALLFVLFDRMAAATLASPAAGSAGLTAVFITPSFS